MAHAAVAVRDLVGLPDGCTRDSSRRGLDGADLAFARDCRRRGEGWQSIAHRLHCNVLTLRRAMGDLPAEPAPPPRLTPLQQRREQVMRAIAEGARNVEAIIRGTHLGPGEIGVIVLRLRADGMIQGASRGETLRLTRDGERWLAPASAAPDVETGMRLRPGTHMANALMAVQGGARDFVQVMARVPPVTKGSLATACSSLRRRGFMSRTWEVTSHGAAELARLAAEAAARG